MDRYGQFTTDESKKVGTVKALVGIDDLISSVLVVDNCAKERDEKAQLKQLGLNDEQIGQFFPSIQGFAPGCPIDKQMLENAPDGNVLKALSISNESCQPIVSPAPASPFVIPNNGHSAQVMAA